MFNFNKLGKSKLFKVSLYLVLTIMFIGGIVWVKADAPGVTLNLDDTESITGDVVFSVNTTYNIWEFPKNVTLYLNYSTSSADRDGAVYTINETNDLDGLANGTSLNTSDFISLPLEAGYYWHWNVYACADNCSTATSPCSGTNLTQCRWASTNKTIYVNYPDEERRYAPIVDLITPADSSVDNDGDVTFNVSITAGDNQDLLNGNVSFEWNITSGDQDSVDANTINYMQADNRSIPTAETFISYNFNTTWMNEASLDDNITIYWRAVACNNITGVSAAGNCSYSTANFTLDIIYTTPESTAPVITAVLPDNGTVNNLGAFNITFNVEDSDSLLSNVTLFLNATNTTNVFYDKDTEITYVENDTMTVITTSLTGGQFNLSDLIQNFTWAGIDTFTATAADGFVHFYLQATDNESNIGYSDNFTIEIDTTAPVVSNLINESITNGTCQKERVNWTTDEPSNFTGYYWQVDAGITENDTVTSQSTFAESLSTNMTNLITNTRYYYNISTCDAHGNCGTSDVTGDLTFGWSICDGWSHYGVLGTTIDTGLIAAEFGMDLVSVWNETLDSFTTYTLASPSLGGNINITRGEGFLIYRDIDGVWERETYSLYATNTTTAEFGVTLDSGWNHVGMLMDQTPENITYGQNLNFSSSFATSNITYTSAYINNDSISAYSDYISGRTRNLKMTAPMREGWAPWLFIVAGGNGTWENRSGFIPL